MKPLKQEQLDKLKEPLPKEAISPNPDNPKLSTIKSIYVTERLNEVFGVGQWTLKAIPITPDQRLVIGDYVIVQTIFEVPDHGIHYEAFGGNKMMDLGDAFKGAQTDALNKLASWMGIGADVYKGPAKSTEPPAEEKPAPKTRQANKAAATTAKPEPKSEGVLPDLLPGTKPWEDVLKKLTADESDVSMETVKQFFSVSKENVKQLMKEVNRILIERARERQLAEKQ